jgi:hypothetical protein
METLAFVKAGSSKQVKGALCPMSDSTGHDLGLAGGDVCLPCCSEGVSVEFV